MVTSVIFYFDPKELMWKCVDRVHLAQSRVKWEPVLVNVRNVLFLLKAGNY